MQVVNLKIKLSHVNIKVKWKQGRVLNVCVDFSWSSVAMDSLFVKCTVRESEMNKYTVFRLGV